MSVKKTPDAVEELCLLYYHALNQGHLPPLLAIAACVFDFLCIHPFRDGNGRMFGPRPRRSMAENFLGVLLLAAGSVLRRPGRAEQDHEPDGGGHLARDDAGQYSEPIE